MQQLDARLAALEHAVMELRSQLEEARTRIRTMRHTVRCPACGGRRILHFRRVNEAAEKGLMPLSLNTAYSVWWGTKEGDPIEAYVCRHCGLLEWHATGLENLAVDGTNVVELAYEEPPPSTEPYR